MSRHHEQPPNLSDEERVFLLYCKNALAGGQLSEKITPESFESAGSSPDESQNSYNWLRSEDVVREDGSWNRARLGELLGEDLKEPEEKKKPEKNPQEIERERAKALLEEEIQSIVNDHLVGGVTFNTGHGATFRPRHFNDFYSTGVENMRFFAGQLRKFLDVPADLHEFHIVLFPPPNKDISIYPDLKPPIIGLGLNLLNPKNLQDTKNELLRLTEGLPIKSGQDSMESFVAEANFMGALDEIKKEGLVADIDFAAEDKFSHDDRLKLFSQAGVVGVQTIAENIAKLLRDMRDVYHDDLKEFAISLFSDKEVAFSPENKSGHFGIDAFTRENFSNTEKKLGDIRTPLIQRNESESDVRIELRSPEELFEHHLVIEQQKWRSLEIDPLVRQGCLDSDADDNNKKIKKLFTGLFKLTDSVDGSLLGQISLSVVDGGGMVGDRDQKTIVVGQQELSDEKIESTKERFEEFVKEFFPAESVASTSEPVVVESEPGVPEVTGAEMPPEPEVVVTPDPEPIVPTPEVSAPAPTSTPSIESIVPHLPRARKEYAEAYEEYLRNNPIRKGGMYGIGGDTSALQAAREKYDLALESAARNLRKAKLDELSQPDKKLSPEKIASEANREVFNELVISEEKRIADLKIMSAMSRKGEALLSERPNQWNRIWQAYVRMPRSRKILYSTLVGTGIAVATGGAVGLGAILLYAGRRAASPLLSAKAGALASGSLQATFGAYDRFTERGRKETKEYKIDALIEAQTEDIAENLDNMRLEYNTILQHQAERKKKRGYYKLAAAMVAGIATGAISSAATHAVTEAAHHIGSAPVSEIAHHGNHSLSAHLESSRNGHHTSGSKPSATKSGGDVVSKGDLKLTPPPPSAEIPAAGAAAEHVVEIQKGDSVWKIMANELKNDKEFSGLDNEAKKTWVLSTLVNRALEHRTAVGFGNANSLVEHTKLNLSEILKSDDVKDLVHRASTLDPIKQKHILENNHTIVNWLKEHPGKPLDEHQVEHILHPSHAAEVPHANALDEALNHKTIAQNLTEHSGNPDHLLPNEDVKIERPDHLEFVDRLDHPVPFTETQITAPAGSISNLIGYWDGHDPKEALRIARDLEDTGRFSTGERASVLDALAHKMGVGRTAWKDIDLANAASVRERAKDFLVSYPEAQRFGFDSYEKYMGLRDMAVGDVIRQIPAPGHWPKLIHHSYFRPGGQFRVIGASGEWQKVPMTREQLQLGVALEKVAKETGDASGKTVSEMLANHRDVFDKNLASVKSAVTKALGHESRHWKGEVN